MDAMSETKRSKSNIAWRRQQAQMSGEHEYHQKREQLFAAAGDIFRKKGFDKASMSDFAKSIGIDRASIYYYVSGKEELFQSIVQKAVEDNVRMVEEIRDSDRRSPAKVRLLIIELMKSYETHYPYLFAYVQEDMNRILGKTSGWALEMTALSDRFESAATAIVQEGIDDGSVDTKGASSRVVTFGIIGMCNWSHRWYQPSGPLEAETIGEYFSNMVLNGIDGTSLRDGS